jgi:serine/threonine protein kinase
MAAPLTPKPTNVQPSSSNNVDSNISSSEIADRYERIKQIGSGSFGTVWLVKSKQSQRQYVLKEIKASLMEPEERILALNEVHILRDLAHPFIVRYRNAYIHGGYLSICMEYASLGDLHSLIRRQRGRCFEERRILAWFSQMVIAIDFIHSRHILHRDIKTQNIFISANDNVKLGDFGISRVLSSTHAEASTFVGTPYYLSPEMCQNLPCKHVPLPIHVLRFVVRLSALQNGFKIAHRANSTRGYEYCFAVRMTLPPLHRLCILVLLHFARPYTCQCFSLFSLGFPSVLCIDTSLITLCFLLSP